jgi:copper chaperone CopZ
MKKIIFSLIAILAISCSADKRSADLVLDSLQCLMCSVNVEESLLSLKGVKKIKVDLKNKSGHVVYNANVIDLSAIENRITSIGYSVNGKYADKNAYEKLEICCKKPEDN